jgi:hypothetical protein
VCGGFGHVPLATRCRTPPDARTLPGAFRGSFVAPSPPSRATTAERLPGGGRERGGACERARRIARACVTVRDVSDRAGGRVGAGREASSRRPHGLAAPRTPTGCAGRAGRALFIRRRWRRLAGPDEARRHGSTTRLIDSATRRWRSIPSADRGVGHDRRQTSRLGSQPSPSPRRSPRRPRRSPSCSVVLLRRLAPAPCSGALLRSTRPAATARVARPPRRSAGKTIGASRESIHVSAKHGLCAVQRRQKLM